MYKLESSGALVQAHRSLVSRRVRRKVAPTVLLLGI